MHIYLKVSSCDWLVATVLAQLRHCYHSTKVLLENCDANDKNGLSEMKILLKIYIDLIFAFSFCGHKGKD